MASLTGTKVSDTYQQLLKLTSQGVGADASAKYIEDGLGTDTALSLSTTRVGIGTTSPSNNAHIYSTSSETGLLIQSNLGGTGSAVGGMVKLALGARNNSGSGQADTQSGDTLGQIMFEGQGTDYSYQGGNIKTIVTTGDGNDNRSNQETAMTFETIAVGSVSPAERMRITGAGKVGIGITSPDSYHSSSQLVIGNTSGEGVMTIVSNASNDGNIYFGDGTTGTATAEGIIRYKHSNNQMELYTGQALALTIDSSQRVGIGTNSPENDVSGLHVSVAASTDQLYLERTGSGTGRYYLGTSNNSFFIVDDAQTATRFTIDSSGNVGIGDTAPTSDSGFTGPVLRVKGSTNPSVIAKNSTSGGEGLMSTPNAAGLQFAMAGNATASHNYIMFRTGNTNSNYNSTERMRITSGGQVLIGTTSGNNTHDKGLRIVTNEVGSNYGDTALSLEGSGGDFYALNFAVSSAFFGFLAASSPDPDFLALAYRTGSSDSTLIQFFANGNATLAGTLTENSDIRLKENIENIDSALSKVNQMRGVTFDRIDTGKKEYGMIAQELEEIIPELVDTVDDGDIEQEIPNLKSIKYTKLTSILIEAVKELSAQNDALTARIEALAVKELSAKVESLEARLDDLEPEESEQEQSPTVKERVNSLEARVNDLENG